MKLGTKIGIFIGGVLLCGTMGALLLPKEAPRNEHAKLKIGIGDDISGIVMEQTVAKLPNTYVEVDGDSQIESYLFQDC